MGVARSTTAHLRAAGHDAIHLADLGMQRAADHEVLAMAAAERRIVLTFDLDFGHILAASGDRTPSVVILRLSSARPDRVNVHVEAVVRDLAEALQAGAIVVVEDGRRRVRRLPVGE